MDENKVVEKSDFDLIAAFKQGQKEAFTMLVNRHKEKAVQMAFIATGNFEEAKDASQEAFVKAYRGLYGFKRKSKFSTWFYRILMNTAKDTVRKRKWQRFLSFSGKKDNDEDLLDQIQDTRALTDQGVMREELTQRINQSLKGFPPQQRWVMTLRFFEEMSLAEIAEAMGLREGTVKATLHAAVKRFKKEMTPYLKEGGFGHE